MFQNESVSDNERESIVVKETRDNWKALLPVGLDYEMRECRWDEQKLSFWVEGNALDAGSKSALFPKLVVRSADWFSAENNVQKLVKKIADYESQDEIRVDVIDRLKKELRRFFAYVINMLVGPAVCPIERLGSGDTEHYVYVMTPPACEIAGAFIHHNIALTANSLSPCAPMLSKYFEEGSRNSFLNYLCDKLLFDDERLPGMIYEPEASILAKEISVSETEELEKKSALARMLAPRLAIRTNIRLTKLTIEYEKLLCDGKPESKKRRKKAGVSKTEGKKIYVSASVSDEGKERCLEHIINDFILGSKNGFRSPFKEQNTRLYTSWIYSYAEQADSPKKAFMCYFSKYVLDKAEGQFRSFVDHHPEYVLPRPKAILDIESTDARETRLAMDGWKRYAADFRKDVIYKSVHVYLDAVASIGQGGIGQRQVPAFKILAYYLWVDYLDGDVRWLECFSREEFKKQRSDLYKRLKEPSIYNENRPHNQRTAYELAQFINDIFCKTYLANRDYCTKLKTRLKDERDAEMLFGELFFTNEQYKRAVEKVIDKARPMYAQYMRYIARAAKERVDGLQ